MTVTPTNREAQQQFDQLFQRSRSRAYRLAYHLTRNATDAEDVTQDAYVRAWHHFDRYNPSHSFEAWLFRIVTNRAIDLQRRRKCLPIYSLDTCVSRENTGLLPANERIAPNSDTEQIVFGLIGEERLLKAVDALPEHHRLVLRMYAVEQRSYEEIAEAMCCALGTARSRIHRARGLLRHDIQASERKYHQADSINEDMYSNTARFTCKLCPRSNDVPSKERLPMTASGSKPTVCVLHGNGAGYGDAQNVLLVF